MALNRRERRRQARQARTTPGKAAAGGDLLTPALAHFQAGRMGDAEVACRAVLARSADHVRALQLLAVLDQRRGREDEAVALSRKAASLRPDDPLIQFNLGTLLHRRGKTEDAIACLRRAIALEPGHAAALNNLATIIKSRGRADDAMALYRRAIAADPGLFMAQLNLGLLLGESGDRAGAIACLRNAAILAPDNAEVHLRLGIALAGAERYTEAVETYRRALTIAPRSATALVNLGTALDALGRGAEAEKSYRRAIEADPRFAPAQHNLGVVLKARGDIDGAISAYRWAADLDPEFAVTHYNLGVALNEAGAKTEAAECFRRALDRDPGMSAAAHLLASLSGATTPSAPSDYVAQLFDDYAERFDAHLTGELGYVAPTLMRQTLDRLIEAPERFAATLDLGCGTGLAGAQIHDRTARLVGVDLSPKMIAEARKKNIYDRLEADEIVAFMDSCGETFDLFLAADVFVYIGDLTALFAAIAARAGHDALLVFTVERLDRGDYRLNDTGRYAHGRGYIEKLSTDAGFSIHSVEPAVTWRQGGAPVAGEIYVLQSRRAC